MAPDDDTIPLSDLLPGEEAVVVRVSADASIRQRLMEMGFVRGQRLRLEKLAPLGDPMELVLKGYHLSLRKSEGACIAVERVTTSTGPGGGPASNGQET